MSHQKNLVIFFRRQILKHDCLSIDTFVLNECWEERGEEENGAAEAHRFGNKPHGKEGRTCVSGWEVPLLRGQWWGADSVWSGHAPFLLCRWSMNLKAKKNPQICISPKCSLESPPLLGKKAKKMTTWKKDAGTLIALKIKENWLKWKWSRNNGQWGMVNENGQEKKLKWIENWKRQKKKR